MSKTSVFWCHSSFIRNWRTIIENNTFNGLRDATFPQRTNCSVTLYQDSHHHPTFQPPFDVCGSPRKLWEDVFIAIEGAKHLIYIAGWSFNPNLILVSKEGRSGRLGNVSYFTGQNKLGYVRLTSKTHFVLFPKFYMNNLCPLIEKQFYSYVNLNPNLGGKINSNLSWAELELLSWRLVEISSQV